AEGAEPTSEAEGAEPTSEAEGAEPTSEAEGAEPTSEAEGAETTICSLGAVPKTHRRSIIFDEEQVKKKGKDRKKSSYPQERQSKEKMELEMDVFPSALEDDSETALRMVGGCSSDAEPRAKTEDDSCGNEMDDVSREECAPVALEQPPDIQHYGELEQILIDQFE
ncbi:hypothetical protein NPIL_29831, partial [Nephila pilipes]